MKMNRMLLMLAVAPVVATALFAQPRSADGPSVLVKTEPPRWQALAETLSAYGSVVPDTGAVETLSIPRPVRIDHLLVAPGQVVSPGEGLIELATDPSASAAYQQAQSAADFARGELQRVQGMAGRRLATRSQVAAAKKSLEDAEALLAAEQSRGAGIGRVTLKAPFHAVVASIGVQQGDRVQGGTALMQLARSGVLRVTLGIEPEDIGRVRVGMPVDLAPVFGSAKLVRAEVAKVFGIINPQTRLVDVSVRLASPVVGLIPGMQVRGAVHLRSRKGWVVPRSAVLGDAQGSYLFQVQDGQARRVEVNPVIENGPLVLVEGPVDSARRIVIQGNYELKDGMTVREDKP